MPTVTPTPTMPTRARGCGCVAGGALLRQRKRQLYPRGEIKQLIEAVNCAEWTADACFAFLMQPPDRGWMGWMLPGDGLHTQTAPLRRLSLWKFCEPQFPPRAVHAWANSFARENEPGVPNVPLNDTLSKWKT
jgi:hypothetical protein